MVSLYEFPWAQACQERLTFNFSSGTGSSLPLEAEGAAQQVLHSAHNSASQAALRAAAFCRAIHLLSDFASPELLQGKGAQEAVATRSCLLLLFFW